ncbi:ribonuclease H family protein [Aeromicrobium sp. 179-A 4D2 NHS]|uniref:ribonuclease H family protein n=1 Tax=Aeromicrobium sp. 179-A 4D2 NHS TaxID=3142375 RepID=UPI0039A0444E
MSDLLLVACDGSCLSNPDGPTGWAWAGVDGSFAYGSVVKGTNNIGELMAVLNVLSMHPGIDLHIQIDSQYAMKAATEWLPGWKRRGWKNSKGETVANKELIQQIDAVMTARNENGRVTHFEWVKGHRKDNAFPLNTEADRLAGLASKAASRGVEEVVTGGATVVKQTLTPATHLVRPATLKVSPVPVPDDDVFLPGDLTEDF